MERNSRKRFADLDESSVMRLVREAVDGGTNPQVILQACQDAMIAVGEKFEAGVYFISDLMLPGHMFKGVNELLSRCSPARPKQTKKGKVVMGTVKGDIHDIGRTWWSPCLKPTVSRFMMSGSTRARMLNRQTERNRSPGSGDVRTADRGFRRHEGKPWTHSKRKA
jgi:hypothetical protein